LKVSSAIRALIVVGALLLAGGCSVKMLYNNADRFARWAANDYIQMDDAQEAYFTSEVSAIHYWHRTSELPRYADYLDTLPAQIDDGVDEAEVQGIFDTFYGWWDVLLDRSLPMVTELLMSLSDEQVARLPERLEKDNREFSEDELDTPVDEIQEDWAREYADTMSRFSGRLTRAQKDYLAAQSVRYVPQFALWADYRQRWQQDLLRLLKNDRREPKVFRERFLALTEHREAYYGAELTAIFDANEALVREVTVWVLNHLTDEQRQRFGERVGDLADTFRELAAEVPDTVPAGGGCLATC
jgi:hypothetical protein